MEIRKRFAYICIQQIKTRTVQRFTDLIHTITKRKYMRNIQGKYYDNGWKDFIGKFHSWGYECEQQNEGNVMWSVAIVELEDGTIITPNASHVKFIN